MWDNSHYGQAKGVPVSHLIASTSPHRQPVSPMGDRGKEEGLNYALALAGIGICVWDTLRTSWHLSPISRALFGLPLDQTDIGQDDFLDLLPDEDRVQHRIILNRVVREGGEYRSRYRVIRPLDGATIWIQEHGRVVLDDARNIVSGRSAHWNMTVEMRVGGHSLLRDPSNQWFALSASRPN